MAAILKTNNIRRSVQQKWTHPTAIDNKRLQVHGKESV